MKNGTGGGRGIAESEPRGTRKDGGDRRETNGASYQRCSLMKSMNARSGGGTRRRPE